MSQLCHSETYPCHIQARITQKHSLLNKVQIILSQQLTAATHAGRQNSRLTCQLTPHQPADYHFSADAAGLRFARGTCQSSRNEPTHRGENHSGVTPPWNS